MKTIPGAKHHVLCTVIDGHQVVCYQVPGKRTVVTEIIFILVQELDMITLATVYP